MTDVPAVRMRGIVKRFEDTLALDGVDFDLVPGEIHALLGENGAGKSTLMNVLGGLFAPNAGTIEVRGSPMRFRSARDAATAGIGMVHQHFTLVDNFTVAENLALALPDRTPFFLPRGRLAEEPLQIAERLGWKFDPKAPVWQLPVGVQQRLEIVKVLAQEPDILIFDEPTAVLAPVELDELFGVLDGLRRESKSIVFISHKLHEVMRLCDRVTVLRQGRNAGTVPTAETDTADLARRMVGSDDPRELREVCASQTGTTNGAHAVDPVLRVRGLWVRDARGVDALRGLELDVSAGEIFAVAGVDGNGQAELAEAVLGLCAPSAGSVNIVGLPGMSRPRQDIGYIPQDRRRAGLVLDMTVRDNLVLELHQEPHAARGPWLRWGFLNEQAADMMARYDIRGAGLDQPARMLSGGNQQKLVIGRALHKSPRLLVAVNPTRGVDVTATAYVHDQLRAQRDRGAAILLISTELDEVLQLADRVGVIYEGRLMGIVPPSTSRQVIGEMMGGNAPDLDAAPA